MLKLSNDIILPDTEIILPDVLNFLYISSDSLIGIVSSDLIYILSPSLKLTLDKSQFCHCPSFILYCITLPADMFGVPFCCIATVLTPVDVIHKYSFNLAP